MPRPKKPGGPEPKKRSRNGCWYELSSSSLLCLALIEGCRPCKTKKVKCGEERPTCLNCGKQGETCDYSIRLNWEGRTKRKASEETPEPTPRTSTKNPEGYTSAPLRKHVSESSETSQYSFASTDLAQRHVSLDYVNANIKLDGEFDRENGDTSQLSSIHAPLEITAPNVWQASSPWDASRDEFSATQLSRLRDSTNSSSPSMISSILDNASTQGTTPSSFVPQSHTSPPSAMPPPMVPEPCAGASLDYLEFNQPQVKTRELTAEHQSKRRRYDPPSAISVDGREGEHPTSLSPAYHGTAHKQTSTSLQGLTHSQDLSGYSSIDANIGLNTPPLSSARSFSQPTQLLRSSAPFKPSFIIQAQDPRRLSVNSLLSSPTRLEFDNQVTCYGVDKGFPDLDTPLNDDSRALDGATPTSHIGSFTDETGGIEDEFLIEFGFGLYGNDSTPSNEEYYSNPVPVEIPKSLEPLPEVLLMNPMNILYFHHFLNHTARILVPHDCPENPFRIILPQMAVRDPNLMHLLLAYSASHRARLLKHAEPSNRISVWVKDVFPSLRLSLSEPTGKISDTSLATAIMLASLEIIAPATFGVDIPWHQHLDTARQIILARGDLPPVQHDKVAQFLYRWFSYLDVCGSLSGAKTTRVLNPPGYSGPLPAVDKYSGQVDCLLGFTSRCVTILAKIADLARLCDSVRIDPKGNIREDWRPTEQIVESAEYLQYHLREARKQPYTFCPHRRITPGSDDDKDMQEMIATNDAFHWAGLIHLYRRVLGKQSDDEDVQEAVRLIVSALQKVRKGGTAEACLLFPMFTAGCDAKDPMQRLTILERIKTVEGSGMTQVRYSIQYSHSNR
jgi:hypothetical protein